MSVVRNRTVRGWALVAALAAVAVLVPQVPRSLPASAAPVDPGTLRDRILASADRPHQGYAEITGTLALPELPNVADVTSLLTTTTRVRSWYAGPSSWRFDVVTGHVAGAGERDVYRTPVGEFTWDYGANLLTRLIGEPPVRLPRAGDLLPPELARRVLVAAQEDPVGALPARRVAGHHAAGLRLTPADPDTTIGHVDMWADPDTGLPVAVELTPRDADRPILYSQFLELDATTPGADVLTPKQAPGSGFTVATAPDVGDVLGTFGRGRLPDRLAGRELREADAGGVRGVGVYGWGLSAFVALPVPGHVGADAAEAITNAGGTSEDLTRGEALRLSIAPLSVVIAHSDVSRRWYLLAGTTTTDVLLGAATELMSLPEWFR
ncbi:hypothetical protein [Actinophytocola sp.]|uniref:hypothetical protein n=1 Tax=Actinophytocola sp. TaxID=1872138 RepID=UPI003D6AC54D